MHPERTQRLERLRAADRHTLPLHLKAEILRELQRLELVLVLAMLLSGSKY